ncbi:MAG: spore coat U domain-containing protein [Acidobacteriota bacterium]
MTNRMLRAAAASVVLSVGLLLPARQPLQADGGGSTCAINSTTAVNFGAYDPFSAVPDDSAGNVKYTCSTGLGVVISLSGVQVGGSRKFTSGTNNLLYNIYSDAARTLPLGDGTNGVSSLNVGKMTSGTQKTQQLYGRIPAGQDVGQATYSATLVITFNF